MVHENFHIGCSGYYYPAWKNKFYPTKLQPKNWLEYYSSVFNTVELNGTFYRTPKLSDLQKYYKVTSDSFTFSVKMSKYITHVSKLKNSKQPILDFQNLIQDGLSDKLSYFLFQLTPSFHYTEENLELVLKNIPHQSSNMIEFRHASWWNKKVENVMKEVTLTFCNVDFPGLESYFITTSDLFYLRLHGNPELFKSSYSTDELKAFHRKFPTGCNDYTIYFNNTYYEAGYTNAMELMTIVK